VTGCLGSLLQTFFDLDYGHASHLVEELLPLGSRERRTSKKFRLNENVAKNCTTLKEIL
jgi:hypothetical protein